MAERGKWVTMNGAHVLIKDGQTAEQAAATLSKKSPDKPAINEARGHSGSILPGKGERVKIPVDYFGKKNKAAQESKEMPPVPKDAYGFYDKHKLTDHFERHGADFGCKTEKEYNQSAINFWTKAKGTFYFASARDKICKLGDDGVTFCSCNKDGSVHTYYKFKSKAKAMLYMKMDGWIAYDKK